jgi:C4-type Zn-finger protein
MNTCPNCGSQAIETRWSRDTFTYTNVTLTATIPFRRCSICGFEYTDWEAENLREKAVERYLGES